MLHIFAHLNILFTDKLKNTWEAEFEPLILKVFVFPQWQVKNQFNKMKWQNPGPYLYPFNCVTVLIISFNWNYGFSKVPHWNISNVAKTTTSQPLIGYRQIQRGFNIGSSFICLMILNYVVTWLKFDHWSLKWESHCVKFTRYKLYPYIILQHLHHWEKC